MVSVIRLEAIRLLRLADHQSLFVNVPEPELEDLAPLPVRQQHSSSHGNPSGPSVAIGILLTTILSSCAPMPMSDAEPWWVTPTPGCLGTLGSLRLDPRRLHEIEGEHAHAVARRLLANGDFE